MTDQCLSPKSTAALARLITKNPSIEDLILLAESEDLNQMDIGEGKASGKTFEETAVELFKNNTFVLLDMYADPKGIWTQGVSIGALDRLIDNCSDLNSLTLLYFALSPTLAYPDSFESHPKRMSDEDDHPNAGHLLVVEAMIGLCKNDLAKLWSLYKRLDVEYYQYEVAKRINEITESDNASDRT